MGVLLITYERPSLLLEALAQIRSQDYGGSIEAIVVDDSADSLENTLASLREHGGALPEHQYIYLKDRATIGAKRNLAARSTRADILCVWDDDDVFTVDRIRKQVEHLLGCDGGEQVACSGIEVASMFSVPDRMLNLRPARLPQMVFENTLCFTRAWWEANDWKFGEAWEVSGQGEGTLEPWWEEVRPLTGKQEPFLYIYLPSSVSGGTSIMLDPHPVPDERMFALVRALHSGRFPNDIDGKHVREVLEGTRTSLENMLGDLELFKQGESPAMESFEAFSAHYAPKGESA